MAAKPPSLPVTSGRYYRPDPTRLLPTAHRLINLAATGHLLQSAQHAHAGGLHCSDRRQHFGNPTSDVVMERGNRLLVHQTMRIFNLTLS